MKKISKGLMALGLVVWLAGCARQPVSQPEDRTMRLMYSNLADSTSQEEVREAMEVAAIPENTVNTFFQDVTQFNGIIEGTDLQKEGFKTIDSLQPEYDWVTMLDMWEAKNPEFIGYNCRITSYDLIKDSLTIGKPDPLRADWLMFDKSAIESSPRPLFTEDEYIKFQALFSSIPTEETKDVPFHVKKVQDEWKDKEIVFPDSDTLSVISVFFHDEEGYLFIGHMGLLFSFEDDTLLFIEKINFQEPYQAIKFEDRVALNDYLMNKYDISWNQPTASPFIMENDQLLEGYRVNPDNPEYAKR